MAARREERIRQRGQSAADRSHTRQSTNAAIKFIARRKNQSINTTNLGIIGFSLKQAVIVDRLRQPSLASMCACKNCQDSGGCWFFYLSTSSASSFSESKWFLMRTHLHFHRSDVIALFEAALAVRRAAARLILNSRQNGAVCKGLCGLYLAIW